MDKSTAEHHLPTDLESDPMADKRKGLPLFKLRGRKLNGYLHRYAKLRGVRWTRYSKVSKLKEEYRELLESITDYEANPSPQLLEHLQEEAADLLFCLIGISEKYGFDLSDAAEHKIQKDTGRNIPKAA